MTVYIDVILIENLVMNYIILFATSIVLKIQRKQIRIILASLLGAIYTVITYISNLKQIYSNIFLKLILSLIIIYIAFYPKTLKKLLKFTLIFYLTSFVFGGAAFALIYIVKPQEILLNNGLSLESTSMKVILISALVAFFIIVIGFKIVKNKISSKDMYCDLEVKINKKTINTRAMIDTGNFLKEPITNTPVIVLEHTLLYEGIAKEILNNMEQILGGDFSNIPDDIREKYISKLKVIPFSSLGKQNGMLLGIKAEEVIIKDEEERKIDNVIIGIYNKSLTKRGEYRALIGLELLEKEQYKINLDFGIRKECDKK